MIQPGRTERRNAPGCRSGRAWPGRPRRLLLARGLLAYAVLLSIYMASTLPFPPGGADALTLAFLLAVAAGSAYGAVTVASVRGTRGRTLTVWMGGWAAVMLALFVLRVRSAGGPGGLGAPTLSFVIAGSMWGAVVLAGVLAWSARRARPAGTELPTPSHPGEACSES